MIAVDTSAVMAVLQADGHGRRLIEAVAAEARQLHCARLYWLTQENNTTARQLHNRVASHEGFARYDYKL